MQPGRGPPPSPAVLEQQFQERIARAKEAARLASIAAAARSQTPPPGAHIAVPGVPYRPPPIATGSVNSAFQGHSSPVSMGNIPPDVKNRIDHLVGFVSRNGEAFEATARHRERDNPDFAFLRPGGPYSDYYQWKKRQVCGAVTKPVSIPSEGAIPPLPSATTHSSSPASATAPSHSDLMTTMSVGAMANVCKLAKASGVAAYTPIPTQIILNVGTLPPVEPARLEIRLSEFYRDEKRQEVGR
ncbi:hypothetical protein PHYBOEH_001886 [Phytophthora boehmeriae]|uniref:SURP motif domain-containing protein n=1 Tax=Phytophthora boehmeriae TaxID=109152 RepID=A0A8T1WWX4_9STRA|nr:hypothetical protein PHYBOEH_001886 [Phytophthora boehmeriae]